MTTTSKSSKETNDEKSIIANLNTDMDETASSACTSDSSPEQQSDTAAVDSSSCSVGLTAKNDDPEGGQVDEDTIATPNGDQVNTDTGTGAGTSITQSQSPQEKEENEEENDEEEEEEQWDIRHIFTIPELQSSTPTKCMTARPKCPLLACTTYFSSLDKENKNPWHSCIDCQEQDFGGWPDSKDELPLKYMTKEHRSIISEFCTGQYTPAMPGIPVNEKGDMDGDDEVDGDGEGEGEGEGDGDEKENVRSETNGESEMKPSDINADAKSKTKQAAISSKTPPPTSLGSSKSKSKSKSKTAAITPSPVPPSSKSKIAALASASAKSTAKSSAVVEKWKQESLRLGGLGKIVLNKVEAKKLVFEKCQDSFAPMNITQLFTEFKGTVPSYVLKECLTDMTLGNFNKETQFADSDDEDDDDNTSKEKKSKVQHQQPEGGDEWSGSMICKEGRNPNCTLYFVDYKKLFNNGDGMLAEDRNELLSAHETAKMELQSHNDSIRGMASGTVQLLSEPTNADMDGIVEGLEKEVMELRGQVQDSQGYKENEKRRKVLKKLIENMSQQWRKRKRITMSFLNMMEDVTEGTVSVKKCMKGDGQMDIDSDEAVTAGQIEFLKQKRERGLGGAIGKKRKKQKTGDCDFMGDENFVGVELNSRGVTRVYMDE